MILSLNLTPEEERRVQEARRKGIDVDAMLHEVIAGLPPIATQPEMPRNGAELVARWQELGVIGAWAHRTDITDSSAYARHLRHLAETRTHNDAPD